jgi:hypothetical protein
MVAPLVGPVPLDAGAWRAAREDAQSTLAGLAVRRAGAGPFRVTDHDVRVAVCGGGGSGADDEAFAWSARTARRTIGLAAVRSLLAGETRTPHDAVRARLDAGDREVRDGGRTVSALDRWVVSLGDAGRSAVAAEAVTWATRLWCALDWSALGGPGVPVVGRDHWWDSPHSALLALRGRADVRTPTAHLVVLSGPRRESVRAELALVSLVEALRSRAEPAPAPGRVVGWWPDSGHIVRVDPHPSVLTSAADAVGLVLAGQPAARSAAA